MSKSRQFSDLFYTRFFDCIQAGRLYKIKSLFETIPIDVNYKLPNGSFSLFIACQMQDRLYKTRASIIKFLLGKGANPNLSTAEGHTVFSWACQNNKVDIVDLFLNKSILDIDLNAQDRNGDTPLMHATRTGNEILVDKIIIALRQFQLSVDICNYQDVTPYIESKRLGLKNIEQILSERGKAGKYIQVCPYLDELYKVDPCGSSNCSTRIIQNKGNQGCAPKTLTQVYDFDLDKDILKERMNGATKVDASRTLTKFNADMSCDDKEKPQSGSSKYLPPEVKVNTEQSNHISESSKISIVNMEVKHLSRIEEEAGGMDDGLGELLFERSNPGFNTAEDHKSDEAHLTLTQANKSSYDTHFLRTTEDDDRAILTGGTRENSPEIPSLNSKDLRSAKMQAEFDNASKRRSLSKRGITSSAESSHKVSVSSSTRKSLSRSPSRKRMLSRTCSSASQSAIYLDTPLEAEKDNSTEGRNTGSKNYGSVMVYEDIFELCPDLRFSEKRSSSLDVRWMLALQAEQHGSSFRLGTPFTYHHQLEKHDSSLSDSSQTNQLENLQFLNRKMTSSSLSSSSRSRRKGSVVQRGLQSHLSFSH